jgi:hypothetical protein
LWAAGLASSVALYLYDYQKPMSHPSLSEALSRPADALVYFLAFLGGPLAVGRHRLAVAVVVGAALAVAFAFACAYLYKFREDGALVRRLIGWAMVGAYSVGTAAMVTAGRLGFGVGQSLSSRYTTFSLYLFVALIYLLPCILDDAERRGYLAKHRAWPNRLAASAAVSLVLAHVLIFVLVIRHNAVGARQGRLRAKACLLFINVVPEERCLTENLYPNLSRLRDRADALDRVGFLRPALIRSRSVRAVAADAGGCSELYGSFDDLSAAAGVYVASGRAWLPDRDEPADAVVLAYRRGEGEDTAFALAEVNVERDPTGASGEVARWRESFSADSLAPGPVELTAWAFDAADGKAHELCGARRVQRPE